MKKIRKILFSLLAFAILIPASLLLSACGDQFSSAKELKYDSENGGMYFSSDLQIKKGNKFVFKFTNSKDEVYSTFYLTTELQEEDFEDLEKGIPVGNEIQEDTEWTFEIFDKNKKKVNVTEYDSMFLLEGDEALKVKKGDTYYIVINIVKDFNKVCNLVVYSDGDSGLIDLPSVSL